MPEIKTDGCANTQTHPARHKGWRRIPHAVWRGLAATECVLALVLGWVFIFLFPIRLTARLMEKHHSAAPQNAAAIRRAQQVCTRLRRVAHKLPWRTSCLVQAMAGHLLLRRRGIPTRIRIGVRKADGKLAAHAWLITDEHTMLLGAEGAEAFTPLTDLG